MQQQDLCERSDGIRQVWVDVDAHQAGQPDPIPTDPGLSRFKGGQKTKFVAADRTTARQMDAQAPAAAEGDLLDDDKEQVQGFVALIAAQIQEGPTEGRTIPAADHNRPQSPEQGVRRLVQLDRFARFIRPTGSMMRHSKTLRA
jgi:hypothetical protein